MRVYMEVFGDSETAAKFNKLSARARPIAAQGINTGLKLMESSAKKRARYKTGNMRRGIHVRKAATASNLNGELASEANYSSDVEEGTRPHVILPKSKKALAFEWNGEQIVVKSVNHPGSKAYPFMKPSIAEGKPKILEVIDKLLKSEISSVGFRG